jgi:hypothetical protein
VDARKWRNALSAGSKVSVVDKSGNRVNTVINRSVTVQGRKAWLCANGEIYAAFEMTPPSR